MLTYLTKITDLRLKSCPILAESTIPIPPGLIVEVRSTNGPWESVLAGHVPLHHVVQEENSTTIFAKSQLITTSFLVLISKALSLTTPLGFA